MKSLLLALLLAAAFPTSSFAAPGDEDPVYGYKVTPPDGAAGDIKSIEFKQTEIDLDQENSGAINAVLGDGEFDSSVTVQIGEDADNPVEIVQKRAGFFRRIRQKTTDVVRLSAQKFEEWSAQPTRNPGKPLAFLRNRRIQLLALEVTTIFGTQYKELVISMLPSPALTGAFFITLMLGKLEWHMLKVSTFLKHVEGPVKWLFNKIAVGRSKVNFLLSSPESRQEKLAVVEYTHGGEPITGFDKIRMKTEANLASTYMFGKITKLNWGLLVMTKLILFSVGQTDGNFLERLGEALQMLSKADLHQATGYALVITALSFPTTKAILSHNARMVTDGIKKKLISIDPATRKLVGDTEVIGRLMGVTRAYLSSALMVRALMVCSFILAEAQKSNAVAVASVAGLFSMSALSWWEGKRQQKMLEQEKLGCEMPYNPSLRQQVEEITEIAEGEATGGT